MTRVLLVDDEKEILEYLKESFEDYEVISTSCPEDVQKIVAEFKPHVIVCDHFMPNITGMQILKMLRNTDIYTPFILFTGNPDQVEINEVLATSLPKDGTNGIKVRSLVDEFVRLCPIVGNW